ncbi:GNAT family N-acetyltransferase [Streptomyces triticagri]|uniref:GNAT family N-acetyltransferase n=1 Tax=Streptomyces triticagri TaxID=2293568 RepID=A0A372M3T7_9ACTN|nr:GNAT family N-acetyltransferase [Streptomyces triticagri]RFU85598.1 GNAT family N-acetyltransferase [Streptomyces triticagri]
MNPVNPESETGHDSGRPEHGTGRQEHDIRRATTVEEVLAAPELFDSTPYPEATRRFLAAPGHHMFLAYAPDAPPGIPVGFITGIEMLHPDKGVEMCLYELGVAEPYRRRGLATALIHTLLALSRDLDCYDMWVGVERDNDPALRAYRGTGAEEDGVCAVLVWELAG